MDKKTKIVIVKTAVMLIAGVGCAAVATAAIKNIVPMNELTKFNKVIYGIGTVLISSVVADAGANYAGNIVDSFTIPTMIAEELAKAQEPIATKE